MVKAITGGKLAARSTLPYRKQLKQVDPNRKLSEAESVFVKCVAEDGMSYAAAARIAYPTAKRPAIKGSDVATKPYVRAAIADRKAIVAQTSGMTKKKVIDGFLEAIDMARVQAEPLVMISGWREIGKMCGFYEPTRAELTISVNGQRTLARLESMKDEELLQLVHEGVEAVDAEFEEVSATLRSDQEGKDEPETSQAAE